MYHLICPIYTATEDDPISICSYCSDSHAGVRWAAHSSTIHMYPHAPYKVDIEFDCYLDNETKVIKLAIAIDYYCCEQHYLVAIPVC